MDTAQTFSYRDTAKISTADSAEDLSKSDPSDTPVFELKDVKRYYPSGEVTVKAVDGISLEIHTGEFAAITGASGSGKTTLLNLMGLLDTPSSGRLLIVGRDASVLTRKEKSRFRLMKIGFIFQFFNLQKNLTALENVMLPNWMAGQTRKEAERRAEELLTRVGLEERMDHLPSELSGGQQQRVAIARALVNSPTVILADEPTGNLDSASTGEVIELFEELNREGQTIVLVTHEREISERTFRTIELRDGRILHDYSR